MNPSGEYLPLRAAAERVYRELAGYPAPSPLGPAFIEAASAALSVFAPTLVRDGESVVRSGDLEAALERLRRAGVCFSEVRQP